MGKVGVLKEFCKKTSGRLACSCIADSPSHNTCVETKNNTVQPHFILLVAFGFLQYTGDGSNTQSFASYSGALLHVLFESCEYRVTS